MPSAGEVASHLLAHLQSQLPPSGFHLEGIEVRVGALVELDRDTLHAALCAVLPGVEVRLTEVAPLLRCLECGAEYPHDEHPCPACGSARAEVVSGTELEIARAWGTKVGG
jgi:Zn finger protein HypA/HybF involved in hydrogenase expression